MTAAKGQNGKSFGSSVLSSGILNRIPGFARIRRDYGRIKRYGLLPFIKTGIAGPLRSHAFRLKLLILNRVNVYGSFDTRWPDKSRFLPLRPVSPPGRKAKPSVCLVINSMTAGGAQRQVAGLACALQKLEYDVRIRVFELGENKEPYLPYLQKHGVDVSALRLPRFSDVKFMREQGVDLSLIRHLPAEIRVEALSLAAELSGRPTDIVHCYLDRFCCIGGFAALLAGVPAIRFSWRNANPSHFSFYRDWIPRLYDFFLGFPHIKAENNSSAGAADYTKWLKLPPGSVEVMPNGIDPAWLNSSNEKSSLSLREEMGIAPEAPVVISIGRIVPQKRHLDIPGILLEVRKSVPSAILVHVGDGILKDELQTRMSGAGLDGHSSDGGADPAMFLAGERENIFDYLRCADVFLLTSAHEGMPNAMMEAMLAGLPVVATRVGGVTDLIEDGVHGYLHDVGDVDGMAKSLTRLLADSALKQRMGNAGRERILSEFTIDKLTDRITRAYREQCCA